MRSYDEFWAFYLSEHSKTMTRVLHFAGTTIGLVLLVYFAATGRWYYFPLFFVVGYAFAWFAHFAVERNRPATFKHPVWSFISDFRMMWFMITRRMKGELQRINRLSPQEITRPESVLRSVREHGRTGRKR